MARCMRFDWNRFIKAVGKTQSDIAEIIGVKQPQISKYSKMGNLEDGDYKKLANEFGETLVDQYVLAAEKFESVATNVPLLPLSAQGGTLNEFVISVRQHECEKIISPIKDVDFAITVSGDSMAPEYPNGCQVFIKRINESAFIEWGKTYVLDTCNGTVVKILTPSPNKNCVRCVSINPDPIFAPFDVQLSDIYGIYRVKLCMCIK